MKHFAFISRHQPTPAQVEMAADQGINLIHIGDTDAFTVDEDWVMDQPAVKGWVDTIHGVVVVHPAAAMRLCGDFQVGVFENANRAAPGEPQSFSAVALHVYE